MKRAGDSSILDHPCIRQDAPAAMPPSPRKQDVLSITGHRHLRSIWRRSRRWASPQVRHFISLSALLRPDPPPHSSRHSLPIMTEALPVPLPVEDEKNAISTNTSSEGNVYIDPGIEKRVTRKCDLTVVPPPLVLFALSFLDRVNIGNAAIQGQPQDLQLTGSMFNVALLILFIPFILLEVPSNLVMKQVRPSTWLSTLLFGCGRSKPATNACRIAKLYSGITNMCMGFVQSYAALVGVRFLLGVFEAGLGPGSIYLIAMYYRRYELPWRLSW